MRVSRAKRWASAVCGAVLAITGVTASADELGDLRDTQKKILERLDAQDKVLQQILQKVQSMPAGGRPGVDPNKVYDIPIAESPIKGPKKAKVTLVEFSDFQCPFCSRATTFANDVLAAFPEDVNLVYKHLPLTQIHPNAMPAAKASIAAQKQGKFWEMHDELFKIYNQLTPENITKAAETLKLDMTKFAKDRDDPATEKLVQADMKLAQEVAVSGTPTFFLAGKRLTTRDIAVVKTLIEEQLKKK